VYLITLRQAQAWCNECQMLPLQASKQVLSWCEPTGTSTYSYIQVCTSTYGYILLCTIMYQYTLVFSSIYSFIQVLRGWDVQDTIVVVQPYPDSIADDIDDVVINLSTECLFLFSAFSLFLGHSSYIFLNSKGTY
jgi:hypothetical protein